FLFGRLAFLLATATITIAAVSVGTIAATAIVVRDEYARVALAWRHILLEGTGIRSKSKKRGEERQEQETAGLGAGAIGMGTGPGAGAARPGAARAGAARAGVRRVGDSHLASKQQFDFLNHSYGFAIYDAIVGGDSL
ncbi:hypothetical protein BGX20_004934, partial [Mortierella sp. AD010]